MHIKTRPRRESTKKKKGNKWQVQYFNRENFLRKEASNEARRGINGVEMTVTLFRGATAALQADKIQHVSTAMALFSHFNVNSTVRGGQEQRRGKQWLRRTCAQSVKPFQFYIRKDFVGDPTNAIIPT